MGAIIIEPGHNLVGGNYLSLDIKLKVDKSPGHIDQLFRYYVINWSIKSCLNQECQKCFKKRIATFNSINEYIKELIKDIWQSYKLAKKAKCKL